MAVSQLAVTTETAFGVDTPVTGGGLVVVPPLPLGELLLEFPPASAAAVELLPPPQPANVAINTTASMPCDQVLNVITNPSHEI